MASPSFGEVLRKVREEVNAAIILENRLGGKVQKSKSESTPTPLPKLLDESVSACKEQRKRKLEINGDGLVDDNEMLKLARHTRNYAIAPYEKFLHYVPRLVNVVTLAEAVPAEGSGVTYPLDLRLIASRCKGAFYAPTRFAAVQLAFSQPRSRILIFRAPHHTLTKAPIHYTHASRPPSTLSSHLCRHRASCGNWYAFYIPPATIHHLYTFTRAVVTQALQDLLLHALPSLVHNVNLQ